MITEWPGQIPGISPQEPSYAGNSQTSPQWLHSYFTYASNSSKQKIREGTYIPSCSETKCMCVQAGCSWKKWHDLQVVLYYLAIGSHPSLCASAHDCHPIHPQREQFVLYLCKSSYMDIQSTCSQHACPTGTYACTVQYNVHLAGAYAHISGSSLQACLLACNACILYRPIHIASMIA